MDGPERCLGVPSDASRKQDQDVLWVICLHNLLYGYWESLGKFIDSNRQDTLARSFDGIHFPEWCYLEMPKLYVNNLNCSPS